MPLNPNIILSGQQPNYLATIDGANRAAAFQGEAQNVAGMRNLLQERGPDIMAGNPDALGDYARFDPGAALGIQDVHQNMQMAKQKGAMEAKKFLADADAAAVAKANKEALLLFQAITPFVRDGNLPGAQNYMRQRGVPENEIPKTMLDLQVAVAELEAGVDVLKLWGGDSGGDEWGLTPQYIVGADGEIQMLQLSKSGASKVVDLPEGFAASRGIEKVDEGTHWRWYNTLTGEPIGEPISKNIATATGQEEGAKAAMRAGEAAWESYGKMNTSLANIDEAIAAIDNNAKSGIVYNMLPNVTLASASLNNAMQRMGLDVIGAVTFGALSEGEMKLAMSTAVPQNLEPAELRKWLVRRRDAQQKVTAMLADAAQFLTTEGNTINGWIAKNKEQNKGAEPTAQPGQGSQDFSTPEAQAVFEKYRQ